MGWPPRATRWTRRERRSPPTAPGAFQRFARLAADGLGGVYVVWHDARSGAGRLYAQHLSGTGAVAVGWPGDGIGVSASSGEQFDAAVAADGAGGLLVAWSDYRGG